MDECASYLIEAIEYTNAIVDISLADSFFENSAEAKEINDRNEVASQGAINSVKKAFQALINAIKTLIKNFTDFIKNKIMTKSEKEEYKQVRAAIRSNPELGNTKVKIDDFSQYEKIYDNTLKEINDEMVKQEPDPQKIPSIMDAMSNKIKNLATVGTDISKRAAIVVPLKTAVDIADKNVVCAQAINAAMNSELISLEGAEKILGNKQVAKYKKKIERYAKNGMFHRAKAKILKYKQATLKSVLKQQIDTIRSYTNLNERFKAPTGTSPVTTGSVIKGSINNLQFTSDVVGGPKGAIKVAKASKVIRGATKVASASTNVAKKVPKHVEKNIKDFKSFIGLDDGKKTKQW